VQSTECPRNWSRGGAVGLAAGFAPWPARRPGGRGGNVCPVLSDNSVVGHTRIHRIVAQGFDLAFQVSWKPRCGIHTHPRDGRPAPAGRRLREGEWHSPNEQFHGQADVRSACAAFWNEPLRIEKEGQEPAVRVVRRQGRLSLSRCEPVVLASYFFPRVRRPDRRGQAPKGTGGMPRRHQIRAWKAAKSPGELPNERRARNARANPGN
jgi:hypothetical protein